MKTKEKNSKLRHRPKYIHERLVYENTQLSVGKMDLVKGAGRQLSRFGRKYYIQKYIQMELNFKGKKYQKSTRISIGRLLHNCKCRKLFYKSKLISHQENN
jgi:hypothetical protein